MKVEDAGQTGLPAPLLKMVPILIISAMTIMAVAMAAGKVIIPPRPAVTLTGIVSDSFAAATTGSRHRATLNVRGRAWN